MPRRSILMFVHIRIVTLSQEGLSSREVSRCLWVNQSDVVRTWGGTEIQELSMTCVALAAQRLLLQLMTATYGFQLGGTLKAMPPCWIMLFCAATRRHVLTQTVQNRLHDAQLHSRRPWRGPHLTPCSMVQMGPKTCWMDSSELASSSIHRWVSHMGKSRVAVVTGVQLLRAVDYNYTKQI